jgi:hypothetical protein
MNRSPLFINVNVSVDSERGSSVVVSVVTTFPTDGEGPYGILSASSKPGATVTDVGGGVYTINFSAGTALTGEALFDSFLGEGSFAFIPRKSYTGHLIEEDGIMVEAISTEQADVYDDEQEPKGVDGDLDPKFTAGTALTGEALLGLHLHTTRESYTGSLMRKTELCSSSGGTSKS